MTIVASNSNQKMKKSVRRTKVTPPQKEMIKQKFIAGETISQIAIEENRCVHTISKIVREEDVQAYIAGMRERFYGLTDTAIETVSVAVKHDPELAWKTLDRNGVIPDRRAEKVKVEVQETTDIRTQDEIDEEEIKKMMWRMASVAIERNKIYGTALPEMDEDLVDSHEKKEK